MSYIRNFQDFDEFYKEHRRHNHSRHTIQSYFNIYQVDPEDRVLFQYFAAITCHYCGKNFAIQYDERTKQDLLEVLRKYGINEWKVATSA